MNCCLIQFHSGDTHRTDRDVRVCWLVSVCVCVWKGSARRIICYPCDMWVLDEVCVRTSLSGSAVTLVHTCALVQEENMHMLPPLLNPVDPFSVLNYYIIHHDIITIYQYNNVAWSKISSRYVLTYKLCLFHKATVMLSYTVYTVCLQMIEIYTKSV